jgi:AcrR family transcriptional regulator
VYAYFDSKNAIYDAMFGAAAAQFADRMAEPYPCEASTAMRASTALRKPSLSSYLGSFI